MNIRGIAMNANDDEIIAEIEKEIAEGTDLDGLIPVASSRPKTSRAVFSIRLAPEELKAISQAARSRGVPIGDFIRDAADQAVRQERDLNEDQEDYGLAAFQADVARLSRKLERSIARKAAIEKGA
jgi:hypothetical protein